MLLLVIKFIACFFLGAIFGNILTTLFFRIPRGVPINGLEQPPMCSSCKTRLKYPYYAPFFQAIFKGLKCFACGAKIPVIYTLIELSVALFCAFFFTLNPMNSFFMVKFLAISILFLSILLYYKHGKIYEKTNWLLLTCTLLLYSNKEDILGFLILDKLIFGIIATMLLFSLNKTLKRQNYVEELLFILISSILLTTKMFVIASILMLILRGLESRIKINLCFLPFTLFLL